MIHVNGSTSKDIALEYARRGLPVFPIHTIRDGRCSCGKQHCDDVGKHPMTNHGFKDASTDPVVIEQLFRGRSDANIGAATGPASDVWVLDEDGPEAMAI